MSERSGADDAGLAAAGTGEAPLGARIPDRAALAIFLLMVLVIFADLLLGSEGIVASHKIGDTAKYFVFARQFGFDELGQGNLALWNPHLFSGTPFVGVFQPSMLYPLNFFYLFLPLPLAINLEITLHILLLGITTFWWTRGRGLSAAAALTSACVAAFGATVSLRVLAGQLTVLDTYAWVPLLLLCIDQLSRRVSLGWTLVAGGATSMILLAGHPPTVFMVAISLALYCVPALVACSRPARFLMSLGVMGLSAAMLAGIQLATGYEVSQESIRKGGMPFDFVTSFSLPPENLLTLGIPYLFGDASPRQVSYFGRWWYWDDTAFVGLTALALAFVGGVWARGAGRKTALGLGALLTVIALGRYTPLYSFLYHLVPGFDLVRSPSKFMFFASLFIALLAGMGVDSTGSKAAEIPGGADRSTESCSMAETTRRRGALPLIARLLASVPPPVKITWRGWAPTNAATRSRAASISWRAARPAA